MLIFCLECCLATLLSARTVAQPYIYDWWGAVPLLAAPPLAFALAGLQNYFTRRPFCSTAFRLLFLLLAAAFLLSAGIGPDSHWTATGAVFEWRIVPAVALVAVAILLLAGVAASLATRLDLVPTLAVSSAVFLAGLMSDYLFGRAAAVNRMAAALYAILPNFQHFWTADALCVNGVPCLMWATPPPMPGCTWPACSVGARWPFVTSR